MSQEGFCTQPRAFPSSTSARNGAGSPLKSDFDLLETPPAWSGWFYHAMGPGQSWKPMSGRPPSSSAAAASQAFQSTLAGPVAPYPDLQGQYLIPYGASPISDSYSPSPVLTEFPSEMVLEVDPNTGDVISAGGAPAYDVAAASQQQEVASVLTPYLSNRPMPSITATARTGAPGSLPGLGCQIGDWANQNKALAVAAVLGVAWLISGRRA